MDETQTWQLQTLYYVTIGFVSDCSYCKCWLGDAEVSTEGINAYSCHYIVK